MKESIPSSVQPVHAAQNPVICDRESLLLMFSTAPLGTAFVVIIPPKKRHSRQSI
jgi:hypothetical protein